MVAGQAKSKMEGLDIAISLPEVISAGDQRSQTRKRIPVLALPCDSPLGRFSVEVSMIVKKKLDQGGGP
jgi:hypothetical protein